MFIWSMVRCCLLDLEPCVIWFAVCPVLKDITCKICRSFFFLQNILDFVRELIIRPPFFILYLMLFSFQEHSYFSMIPYIDNRRPGVHKSSFTQSECFPLVSFKVYQIFRPFKVISVQSNKLIFFPFLLKTFTSDKIITT